MQKEETYWKHDIKIPAFSPIHAMVMRNAMYKSVRQVLHYKALPKVLPFAKMKFTLYSAYRSIGYRSIFVLI